MRDRSGLAIILALTMLAACDRNDRAEADAARTPPVSTVEPAPIAEAPKLDRGEAGDATSSTEASTVEASAHETSAEQAPMEQAPVEQASDDANPESASISLRASFAQCAEASGGVDAAMQDCIANEYGYHDDRLNAAYAGLKRALPADRMTGLRAAQRQWLSERDRKCTWDAATEGSAQRLQANYCRMEATAKRADELEAMR